MIRPVPLAPSQLYGENPTSILPADHWLIRTFGNYQPDGHTGEDYPCTAGTPVRAVTDGTVLHVGYLTGTYLNNPWWIVPGFAGYVVVIDHGWFIGIYGHCLEGSANVAAGQRVAEGDAVVLSGNTGASTGDHLHFEALLKGAALNSRMYGRINPATLWGSITPQGTITLEEDMPLTREDIDNIAARVVEVIQPIEDVTRQYLSDRTRDAALAVLNGSQAQEDVTRQYLVDSTQAQADVTRRYLSDRIAESTPEAIVSMIPDAVAQGVLDGLAARLGK